MSRAAQSAQRRAATLSDERAEQDRVAAHDQMGKRGNPSLGNLERRGSE
jgi:hypothetical protein